MSESDKSKRFIIMLRKVLLYTILFLIENAITCERPLEIRGVEDHCWSEEVEIIDRIQHAEKSVINFAKRKLGLDVSETNEPQKCDYYSCILKEMNVMTSDHPDEEKISKWIKKNVIYSQAITLLDRLRICDQEYENATSSGTPFISDNVDQNSQEKETTNKTNEPQSNCEIAAEYLKCLSIDGKDKECPIFQYP